MNHSQPGPATKFSAFSCPIFAPVVTILWMNQWTDSQLLLEYAERRSEAAFAELVRRHVDLVYSAAFRMMGGDAHLAQDVTQASFIALAQNAGKLTRHPVLSGWLHHTARNLAANTIRSDTRRRAREQEAAAMNELLSTQPDIPWDQLAPHLDTVLGELDEGERDALLLRYFERKSAREMGRILGISDEAAQKRVTRALEHLRGFFARRGVAVGTGGLVVALSANSVHAAPAGLAATISAAAAATVTGAAIQTSTVIAATKTLAMTTLQKTIVGATLLVGLGAGLYGVRESAQARHQAQAAQEQVALLSQAIQQLQRERDDATNQLAGAAAELAQLKQTQTSPELLRLRGQVGSLRHELASTVAKSNSSSGFAKMMSDPAMREYVNQAMTDMIKRRYGALFTELKLTPEQTEQFVQVVSSEFHKGAQRLATAQQAGDPTSTPGPPEDRSELNEKLRALLGDSGFARFGEYSQEVPARTTVDLLDGRLGASKLTDEQRMRLLQVVKAEPFDLTHGIAGDLDKVFFGSQPEIDSYLAKVGESNQRVLQQAGEFLNSDQLAALNLVLSNGVTARVLQAAAFTAKH
jgi:RNA polymerase sigma factor (sigma-70 family)